MRKLAIGLLAAAGVALAGSASAQGFYFGAGPGGIGVGVGGPGYYGHRYGGYDDGYRWGGGYRSYAYEVEPGYVRCRTTFIRNRWGELRRVRRCW